jgi:hypothetical protein
MRWNEGGDQFGNTMAPRGQEMRDQNLDRGTFGGRARRYGPNGEIIPSSSDEQVQQYHDIGSRMGNRGAYQNDYGLSHENRGAQGEAMGLMRGAANGSQPSRAELLGRRMIDDSVDAGMATAASSRGGALGAASAMQAAQRQGVQMRQAGSRDLAAMRADEMSHARDAYMGAATAGRGQDLQESFGQAENERYQRGLNQQGQMGYDQMANDIQARDQQAAMQQAAIDSSDYQKQKEMNAHSQDRETGLISSIAGGAAGAVGGLFDKISDPRAKEPMGTLGPSPLSYAAGPQAAPGYAASRAGGAGYMFGEAPETSSGFEAAPMGAPGTSDWNSFGAPGAADMHATMSAPGSPDAQAGAIDWTRGGASAPAGAPADGAPGGGSAIGNAFRGFAAGFNTKKVSDPMSKLGTNPLNSPVSGPAPATFDKLSPGGGMDVMGSIKAHSNVATQYVADPTGGAMKISDERAKTIDPGPRTGFETKLSPSEERAFRAWKHRNAPHDSGADYDLRGAFKAGLEPDKETGHWPDTFKKPNHETFSDESQYADFEPGKAGRWDGETYVAPGKGGPAPWLADYMQDDAMKISDPSAKREAFEQGAAYADAQHAGVATKAPDYARSAPQRNPTLGPVDEQRAHDAAQTPRVVGDPARGKLSLQQAPPAQMMDAIGPGKAFRYKEGVPGEDPSKVQFGTTTADLKKTPMGATMVEPHPSGYEAINTREAVGPTLASLGNLNQRIRMLEQKKKGAK